MSTLNPDTSEHSLAVTRRLVTIAARCIEDAESPQQVKQHVALCLASATALIVIARYLLASR